MIGVPSLIAGAEPGATNSPALEMNPVAWLPPATPSTSQVTFVLAVPVTFAVNCSVPNTPTVDDGALTDTVTLGAAAVTVMVADPDFDEFACEVAVTVTVAGFGTFAGAVYNPVGEIVPFAAPPITAQVTAVSDVPVTVAVN